MSKVMYLFAMVILAVVLICGAVISIFCFNSGNVIGGLVMFSLAAISLGGLLYGFVEVNKIL